MSTNGINRERATVALLALLYRARLGAAIVFVLGIAATIAIAFFTRPIYRAEVIVVVASGLDEAGLSSVLGQFGGLASLVGVNLPSSGGISTSEAIAVLSSDDVTRRYIENENLLPD